MMCYLSQLKVCADLDALRSRVSPDAINKKIMLEKVARSWGLVLPQLTENGKKSLADRINSRF